MQGQPGSHEVSGSQTPRAIEMLESEWGNDRYVCAGLDPTIEDFTPYFDIEDRKAFDTEDAWNEYATGFLRERLMEAAEVQAPNVAMFKPNSAFYEQYGSRGLQLITDLTSEIHRNYPSKVVTDDAKRGDIGSTAAAYARAIFNQVGADATTVNPYMGREAVEPFASYKDRLSFVLVRTTNPSAGTMQDVELKDGRMYWEHVAEQIANEWNGEGNLGIVMGATAVEHLPRVREIVGPQLPILAPGVGSQGGSPEAVMEAGNGRAVVNASRSLILPKLQPGEAWIDAVRRSTQDLHNVLVAAKPVT